MDNKNVVVLDSEEERVPSEEEIREYAEFLGIDVEAEPGLMWIAREGVVAPVPHPWKVCTENGEDVFYFNFESGESVWDHPCDEKYRNMVEEHRKKDAGATGGSSLESDMSSKLESSANSPRSPAAAPAAPAAAEAAAEQKPKLAHMTTEEFRDARSVEREVEKSPGEANDSVNISKDGASGDQIKPFDGDVTSEVGQDSKMDSKLGSSVLPGSAGGSPGPPEVIRNEVSDEESASSEAISGPPSPARSASGTLDSTPGEPKEVVADAKTSAPSDLAKEEPQSAVEQPAVGIGQSPPRGLLEVPKAVAGDQASEDGGEITDEESVSAATSPTGRSASASALSAAPGPSGDDAAGRAYSEEALLGWRSLTAPLLAQAAAGATQVDAEPATAAAPAHADVSSISIESIGLPEIPEQSGSRPAWSAAEDVKRLLEELGDGVKVCILGGTEFQGSDSEELVRLVAQELTARLGSKACFITGGLPGVQQAFATACRDGTRLWNVLPVGKASRYGVGRDVNAGASSEQWQEVMARLGDIYVTVEGGPGVSHEAQTASARGAAIVPLVRTGLASAGRFDFPAKALERPSFAAEEHWALLRRSDVATSKSAAAVAAIVARFAGLPDAAPEAESHEAEGAISSAAASEASEGPGGAAELPSDPKPGAGDAAAEAERPREAAVGSSPPKARWHSLEAELESLSRCLVMLRDVREKQRKYLQLLQG